MRARGDADARGDQIGVEPGLARRRRDLDQIAARAGLAAGEMHLQHAERRGLGEHPRPGRGVELVVALLERQRIGAIRTAERAAVRQLGQQAKRLRQFHGCGRRQFGRPCCVMRGFVYHNSSNFLSARPSSSLLTSAWMRSRGALKRLRQVVDDRGKRRLAGAALEDFDRDRVGLEDALRRQQHPAALRLVVDRRTPRGRRGRASGAMASPEASPAAMWLAPPGALRPLIRYIIRQLWGGNALTIGGAR